MDCDCNKPNEPTSIKVTIAGCPDCDSSIADEMKEVGKLVEQAMVKAGVPDSAVGDDKWWREARALGDRCVRELEAIAERWGR